jgi:large subunit ribosomal protein L21
MYAIVDIAGQQVKVEKGQKILVHRLQGDKGSKVDFDKVMLITDSAKTAVGNPVIEGAQVQATILDHLKGDKVFVFKKKNRKGFKRFNGHRQYLSLIEIEEILEKGAKPKKEEAKKAKKEVAEEVVEAPVAETPVAETEMPAETAKPKKSTRKKESATTEENTEE